MSEWQPIETAPKDGTHIFVVAPGYEWPEVIRWQDFDAADAEEAGEPGYWHYSESIMSDMCIVEFDDFTHWMPIPNLPWS